MAFQTTLTPELIERYTDQRYWLGRTITDYLDEAAERTTQLLVQHCDTLRVPLPSSVQMTASGWLRGLPHDETVCGTDVL